jgi:hypothetical protein
MTEDVPHLDQTRSRFDHIGRRIVPQVMPLEIGYARLLLKYVLPLESSSDVGNTLKPNTSRKFPFVFFACVIAAVVSVIVINIFVYDIRPGNSELECTNGCAGNTRPEACKQFCNCIYNEGNPLDKCLEKYRVPLR